MWEEKNCAYAKVVLLDVIGFKWQMGGEGGSHRHIRE